MLAARSSGKLPSLSAYVRKLEALAVNYTITGWDQPRRAKPIETPTKRASGARNVAPLDIETVVWSGDRQCSCRPIVSERLFSPLLSCHNVSIVGCESVQMWRDATTEIGNKLTKSRSEKWKYQTWDASNKVAATSRSHCICYWTLRYGKISTK